MLTQDIEELKQMNDFQELVTNINTDAPKWLSEYRQKNITRFTTLGIPSTKNEEWKYTNITGLAKEKYALASDNTLHESDTLNAYLDRNELNIVFVNGIFSQELSTLQGLEGIAITTIADALKNDDDVLTGLLNNYDPEEANTFTALNNSLMTNGTFIDVAKNTINNTLIHIVHVASQGAKQTVCTPRTVIRLNPSSEATVLESHISFDDNISYLSSPLTDIFLNENAVLHYCKAQKESSKAAHIGNTRVWQERNSNLDSISVMTNTGMIRNNIDVVINGEGSNATINGLYSMYGKQHVDNHTSVDHREPNCTSNQLYKGIMNESSRAVFNGKIFVKPIAQLTNSYQLNKNLMLGKDSRVDTKPQLEIFADDVKCTHGATIGQLNEDELFYLQTRCIPKSQAVKMLARGFVDDLLNTIKSESIVDKLHYLLESSFERL